MSKEIVLANPRGFCAGVDRAIDIVEKSLKKFDQPVFVRHQVVHNKKVVEDLEKKGVKFVKEIEEIPDNAVAIFSAHGVSKAVEDEARQRKFMYFDATCPLVTKVHLEVQRHARKGRDIVLIGHKGHPEVIGTLGRHPEDSETNIYLVENHDDINKLEIKLKTDLGKEKIIIIRGLKSNSERKFMNIDLGDLLIDNDLVTSISIQKAFK